MEIMSKKLNELELNLLIIDEQQYAVKRKDIANPLFFFNPNQKSYNGSVVFKSINTDCYTPQQIKGALEAVNSYLMGWDLLG